MMPRSKGQPWGPPNPTHELGDRRRPGRHDFENDRLLRLLPNPLGDPEADSTDPAPEPPNLEPAHFSLRATVLAAVVLWSAAALAAIRL
jgi:hypothetical protein